MNARRLSFRTMKLSCLLQGKGNVATSCVSLQTKVNIAISLCRSIVNAVSSTTGNVVGVFREHHSLITAISIVEGVNEVTVYSASVDGVIYAWNLVRSYFRNN